MTTEWKLVPVEPTGEMLRAVNGCSDDFPDGKKWVDQCNYLTYQGMLRAAPQPPSQWPDPRPMSEAPHEIVLAWWPEWEEWIATWWSPDRDMWLHALSECDEQQPTYWLPMPPEPAKQETTK